MLLTNDKIRALIPGRRPPQFLFTSKGLSVSIAGHPCLRAILSHKLDVASSLRHNLWSTSSRTTAETLRMSIIHLPDLWGLGLGHQGVLSDVCYSCVSKSVIASPFTGLCSGQQRFRQQVLQRCLTRNTGYAGNEWAGTDFTLHWGW